MEQESLYNPPPEGNAEARRERVIEETRRENVLNGSMIVLILTALEICIIAAILLMWALGVPNMYVEAGFGIGRDAALLQNKSSIFATITGMMYHGELWVYPDDATTVSVTVRCGDDSGAVFDQSFTGLDQDAWNKIILSYEETGGGSNAYVAVHSGAATSGDWYVDNVSLCSFQGGREMDAELKSIEWTLNTNMDIEFVPGAGGAYASAAFRNGRVQTIKVDREFRNYILQQHIDDSETLGLYVLAEGAVYNSPHKYQVELMFPDVAVVTAPISVDGKRLAEAGDLLVLEDDTYGSVIAFVKNVQSAYAA